MMGSNGVPADTELAPTKQLESGISANQSDSDASQVEKPPEELIELVRNAVDTLFSQGLECQNTRLNVTLGEQALKVATDAAMNMEKARLRVQGQINSIGKNPLKEDPIIQEHVHSLKQSLAEIVDHRVPSSKAKVAEESLKVEERKGIETKAVAELHIRVSELIDRIDEAAHAVNRYTAYQVEQIFSMFRKLRMFTHPEFEQDLLKIHRSLSPFLEHFPEYQDFDFTPDVQLKEANAQRILPLFYKPGVVKASHERTIDLSSVYKRLHHPLLVNAYDSIMVQMRADAPNPLLVTPADIIRNGELLSDKEALSNYFSDHTEEYNSRLDLLSARAGLDRKFLQEKKVMIVIPAMNEDNLVVTVNAYKESFSGDFDKEVGVLVYHNYKDASKVRPEVRTSINEVSQLSNVLVVEEEVPKFNTTGMAKKVASDLVMRALFENDLLDTTLVMTDADVVKTSSGVVERMIGCLSQERRLAVSPIFDYDRRYSERYPVLDIIWKIRREIAVSELAENEADSEKNMTYGMCYAIKPRTLALIGGIKPVEQFEDAQLTKELVVSEVRGYLERIRRPFTNPVKPLGPEGHFVEITPDREISAILSGRPQWSRWMNERVHYSASGEDRLNGSSNIQSKRAEFAEFNEANLVEALNNSAPFVLPSIGLGEAMNGGRNAIDQSKKLLRILKSRGIVITSCSIITFPGFKMVKVDEQQIYAEGAITEGWGITNIESVRFQSV